MEEVKIEDLFEDFKKRLHHKLKSFIHFPSERKDWSVLAYEIGNRRSRVEFKPKYTMEDVLPLAYGLFYTCLLNTWMEGGVTFNHGSGYMAYHMFYYFSRMSYSDYRRMLPVYHMHVADAYECAGNKEKAESHRRQEELCYRPYKKKKGQRFTDQDGYTFDDCYMAAERGNEIAQYCLGIYYLKGEVVEYDEDLGLEWIKVSALNGYEGAIKFCQRNDIDPKSFYDYNRYSLE